MVKMVQNKHYYLSCLNGVHSKNTNILLVSSEKFKERLGVSDKYNVFQDLKKRVIEPAISELNRKSHLNVTFKSIREGRAIKKLEFFFSEK